MSTQTDEETYRPLFVNNPLPMWFFDEQTLQFLEVNEAAVRHYGYSRDEFLQMRITDIRPENERDRLHEHLEGQNKARQYSHGWKHLRRDGSVIEVEITALTMSYAGREARLIIARDTTETWQARQERERLLEQERVARARAEAAEQRQRFRAEAGVLLGSSMDYATTLTNVAQSAVPHIADWCAISIREEDGTLKNLAVMHRNPAKIAWAAELQERYPSDPDAPRGIYNVFRSGQPELYAHISDELLEATAQDREHLALLRGVGMRSAMIVPLMAHGQALGVITFISTKQDFAYGQDDLLMARDLAVNAALAVDNARLYGEAQQANELLERRVTERTEQLRAANGELETFAYSVSHDLRAPLRGIDGFSQALLEEYRDQLDETGQHYIARIRAGAQRMSDLIDDLLELSRLTRRKLERRSVNLSTLAEAIVTELGREQPQRSAQFVIAPDVVVDGDHHLLQIMLQNLLDNAWKFTARREQTRIEFGAGGQVDGTRLYFVRDNGVGFDMAYADKLFGAFQRLHGVKDFPGTGIGLATVQRVVNRHGGRIWADAAVEKGATFYFTLGEGQTLSEGDPYE